eukprot:13865598-Alexandrium_andersonii.AAC.1
MDAGALEPKAQGAGGESPGLLQSEAAFALLQRAFQPGKGEGKGGELGGPGLSTTADGAKGEGRGNEGFQR